MKMPRHAFIGLVAASSLTGCARIATSLNRNETVRRILMAPERLNLALIGSGQPLAREYMPNDVSSDFRQNGFDPPSSSQYQRWSEDGWRGFTLRVEGLVERPASYDLATLRHKFVRRSQITRHDCVEGWSVIGKWSGVLVADLLADCGVKQLGRYVVFHSMDDDGSGNRYYESLDMRQAAHPQAVLAYHLNDRAIPVKNGAPLRLKVPTQLGYKSAKYVQRIEVVASLGGPLGQGGYWEDRGYEWYAGI
jgi:DMSO/TMAO reductase YedYZ molybdopterin-dependent catalytic subunit